MIDLEQLQRDIRATNKQLDTPDLEARITTLKSYLEREYKLTENDLTVPELRVLIDTVLYEQTAALSDEVEELMVQKERIERQLERKSEQLQEEKHRIFDTFESLFASASTETQAKLHQIRLQSIDLFDMLEEVVESAIITTLEKNHDIKETVEEICKEITYETLAEGPLETGRIRLVIGTILRTAVNVAEATPNQAEAILSGSLRGIRSGLVKSIRRLKKQLLFLPEELKLTEAMQTELLRTDSLLTQLIQDEAQQCDQETRIQLEKLSKEMRYDLEELVEVSRETVELMKTQFSQAISRSQVLNSKTASEAKRMGVSAWRSAKTALEGALQNAKEKIEKK